MKDNTCKETAEQIVEQLPLQGVTVVVTRTAMEGEEPPTLEQVVDTDIDDFKKFFCDKLGNDSLSNAERAIIKTWLYWKVVLKGETEMYPE